MSQSPTLPVKAGFASRLNPFSNMSIATKLPIMIALVALVVTVVTTTHGFMQSSSLVRAEITLRFKSMIEDRERALTFWFENLEAEARIVAQNPGTRTAVKRFTGSFASVADDPQTYLQDWYVTNNPNKAGEKDLLDFATDGSTYSIIHSQFHSSFRTLQIDRGFYDVFLFDTEGNLVYSVFKEADFATNFLTGEFADSGLGSVYRSALEGTSGTVYFDDLGPYAPSAGAPASFVSTQVLDERGDLIGVLAFQIPADQIATLIESSNVLGKTGDVYLVGRDNKSRSYSVRHEGRLEILQEVPKLPQIEAALSGQIAQFEGTNGLSGNPVLAVSAPLTFDAYDWIIVGEQDSSETFQAIDQMRNTLILELGSVLLAVIALGWFIARSLTRRIAGIDAAVSRIAKKDYVSEVPDLEAKDEIGKIAQNLDHLKTALVAAEKADAILATTQSEQKVVVEALQTGLKELADGNLVFQIENQFPAEHEPLRQDFNTTVEHLRATLGSVIENAEVIGNSAKEISESSSDLSQRTENQAATLQETAVSIDELANSVRDGADDAKQAEKVVSGAKMSAERGGQIVKSTTEAMSEIKRSSDEISKIIGVIEDIAFQTNLLALNAGVEAARAGEVGKGFAVVASEVRALAQRSSDSAKEIKALIDESTIHVGKGVELVGETGTSLTGIVEQVSNIADLVGNIAEGASEQSSSLGEINVGVTQLDSVTQQNAAMAEEATAAGHALDAEAKKLNEAISNFKIDAPSTYPVPGSAASTVTSPEQAQKTEQANVVDFSESKNEPVPEMEDWASTSEALPTQKRVSGSDVAFDIEDEGMWREF